MSTFDYQLICSEGVFTSKEERDKKNIGPIWSNEVQCLKCNNIIRSKNQHDFRFCKCGSIAVDGGSWYLKRCGDPESYKELSRNFEEI